MSDSSDSLATALRARQEKAIENIPLELKYLSQYAIALAPYNVTGWSNLRALLNGQHAPQPIMSDQVTPPAIDNLQSLIDRLADKGKGIVLTMGKGGVGKTTVAAALAVALVDKGLPVHLTTTDPAAHIEQTLGSIIGHDQLKISRIDPKIETELYKQTVIEQVGSTLDEDGLALLKEDLASPCTEEIAVFKAFTKIADEAKDRMVIFDTAPTGHTLLLLDATQSYHRQVEKANSAVDQAVKNLLPTLRNPKITDVLLVTLPEATPVLEADRLQQDLIRAGIKPSWWIINQSWSTLDSEDPVLQGRALSEGPWIRKVKEELAEQCALINWQAEEPVGWENLLALTSSAS